MDSEILWTEQALQQLEEILEYFIVRNNSDIYSKKLKNLIAQKLLRLTKNPFSGIPTSEEKYRIIVVENYLVYYTINPLIVVLIWDGRRNPEELQDEIAKL